MQTFYIIPYLLYVAKAANFGSYQSWCIGQCETDQQVLDTLPGTVHYTPVTRPSFRY